MTQAKLRAARHPDRWPLLAALCLICAAAGAEDAMLRAVADSGYRVTPIFTVGDTIGEYRPVGILDGLAAFDQDSSTVRLLVNHEIASNSGYTYRLANGTRLRGARISFFDIDKRTRRIVAAGMAFGRVRDRDGEPVTSARQISERWWPSRRGFDTLCSGAGYRAGELGFVDDIFFSHEEVSSREGHPHGGSIWALDLVERELWALPELGRGSWENSAALATPDGSDPDGHVAMLLGDDLEFGSAPLYLWIGRKRPGGNFIERNGLAEGRLFVWVADDGSRDPQDWNGTGTSRNGRFVPIDARDSEAAGSEGYDDRGYLDDDTLRAVARRRGAFFFSRPEDLHTDPDKPNRAAFASTGMGRLYPADDWGTLYLIDIRFTAASTVEPGAAARLDIFHDGDDFGDFGIRNPDNLVWAHDGMVYVQEDKATKLSKFGADSGRDASIWRIDPDRPDDYARIAEIDRAVVLPADATDAKAGKLGAWESSGVVDASEAFGVAPPAQLLIATIQAHGITDGSIGGPSKLVKGGQIVILERPAHGSTPESSD